MSILPHTLTHPIMSVMSRWFAKRAPKSDSASLNVHNVYMFFSREGFLFALLLVIILVAGINYGNNLVLGLFFYLVSVLLISCYITFIHISGLQVQLLEVTMAEAGESVWVTLHLRNESRQSRRQLVFSFDQHIDKSNFKQGNNNLSVDAQTQVLLSQLPDEQIIRLSVPTHHRGPLELPRLKIKTVYPLGIMRAWSYVYFARTAWIYPKPEAFEWQAKYIRTSSDSLLTGGQYTQGQEDFERLDSYVEGESLARVSWAHVARGQGMFTKHFADCLGHEHLLDYADMPALHHEQRLAQLAYGAITLGKLGVPFKMYLSDDENSEASIRSPIGQGHAFTQACLLRLAKAR